MEVSGGKAGMTHAHCILEKMQRAVNSVVKRILLLKKTSRLEYERRLYLQLREDAFRTTVRPIVYSKHTIQYLVVD